jgi:hypothetical protein
MDKIDEKNQEVEQPTTVKTETTETTLPTIDDTVEEVVTKTQNDPELKEASIAKMSHVRNAMGEQAKEELKPTNDDDQSDEDERKSYWPIIVGGVLIIVAFVGFVWNRNPQNELNQAQNGGMEAQNEG